MRHGEELSRRQRRPERPGARYRERETTSRQCARPGCSDAACATLAYDYEQRITWLDPLSDESHPMAYDLCHDHAQAMTVPRGWRLEDRRDPLVSWSVSGADPA